jgi:uncharacterized delta-60 repeat protein
VSVRKVLTQLALVWLAVGLTAGVEAAGSEARARPDPTFGHGRGWVTTRIAGASAFAAGAAVIGGGKIVVAGVAFTPAGNEQVVVVRYQRDGRVDRRFASAGIFKTAPRPSDGRPFSANSIVQERSTGRLLIAGGYGLDSMLVLRLTRGGRVDRTFGPNRRGFVTIAAGGVANAIAIQRGGGILLGGANRTREGHPMVVARLTRNGVLDRRFGRRGLAQALFWNPVRAASAGVSGLASSADGGVIASGHIDYIGGDGHGTAGVFRLSSRGRLVRGFGTAGHVEVAFPKIPGKSRRRQWFPCAMTVDPRGRITVTGGGTRGGGDELLTARLSPRGRLDRSYGKRGRAVTRGLGESDQTICGATSSAAGAVTVGVGSTLVQLRGDGRPNGRFGRGGFLRIRQPKNVGINAVVASGSCRVVLAGSAGDDIYAARYLLPRQR